jgi:hypothetical protein
MVEGKEGEADESDEDEEAKDDDVAEDDETFAKARDEFEARVHLEGVPIELARLTHPDAGIHTMGALHEGGAYVKERKHALQKNMLVAAVFEEPDAEEPVYIFKVHSVVEVKATDHPIHKWFVGTWVRGEWWSSDPRSTGRYGIMEPRMYQNIPVALKDDKYYVPPYYIHWSDQKTLPLLTGKGRVTKAVQLLATHDVRLVANGLAAKFKHIWAVEEARKNRKKKKRKPAVLVEDSD